MGTGKVIQICSFTLWNKRSFTVAMTNEKFTGMTMLMSRGLFWIKFASFIIHICFGKYSYSFNAISTHFISTWRSSMMFHLSCSLLHHNKLSGTVPLPLLPAAITLCLLMFWTKEERVWESVWALTSYCMLFMNIQIIYHLIYLVFLCIHIYMCVCVCVCVYNCRNMKQ